MPVTIEEQMERASREADRAMHELKLALDESISEELGPEHFFNNLIKRAELKNLRALVLWQPWASLLVRSVPSLRGNETFRPKLIETRGWNMSLRGPLVIQAAKTMRPEGRRPFEDGSVAKVLLEMGYTKLEQMPFGRVLGVVNVSEVVPTEELLESGRVSVDSLEYRMGDFSEDRFGYVTNAAWDFALPSRDLPVMQGQQGLFGVPEEVQKWIACMARSVLRHGAWPRG